MTSAAFIPRLLLSSGRVSRPSALSARCRILFSSFSSSTASGENGTKKGREVRSLSFQVLPGEKPHQKKKKSHQRLAVKRGTVGKFIDVDKFLSAEEKDLTVKEVADIFLESTKLTLKINNLEVVTRLIAKPAAHIDASSLSVICCGFSMYTSDNKEALKLISATCDLLETCGHEHKSGSSNAILWKAKEIAHVLYGLKGMSSAVPEVQRYIRLIPLHAHPAVSKASIPGAAVARGLLGFQSLNSSDLPTRNLLTFYSKMIRNCNDVHVGNYIASCLRGLKGCDSSHKEVCDVIESLGVLLEKSLPHCTPIRPWDLGAALSGLRNMNNCDAPVEYLLSILVKLLPSQDMSQEYDAYSIGSAFLGLQQMTHDSPSVSKILEHLAHHLKSIQSKDFNDISIANIFCGLQNMTADSPEVREIVRHVSRNVISQHRLPLRSLSMCLYGLKSMSPQASEVTLALSVLRKQLQRLEVSRDASDFNSKVVSLSSGVFQSMDASAVEVRRMVKAQAVAWALGGEWFRWDMQAISDVLFNMKNMSNEHSEVQSLLRVVLKQGLCKLSPEASVEPLALSNCLYGLRSMTSEFCPQRMQEIVSRVTELMESHATRLSPWMVCLALNGCQNFSSERKYVRRLAKTAAEVLHSRVGGLDDRTLSLAFLGLQSMSNSHWEVSHLLQALSKHLDHVKSGSSSGECIGNVLYGLQLMHFGVSENSDEVLIDLLEVLNGKVNISARCMDITSLAMSLYGIASILNMSMSKPSSDIDIVKVILERLLAETVALVHCSDSGQVLLSNYDLLGEVVRLFQSCSLLREILEKSSCYSGSKSEELLEVALAALQPFIPHSDVSVNAPSETELVFADHICSHFEGTSKCRVLTSQLLNGFSADIVVKFPSASFPDKVFNIEIDGPSHEFPRKKRFMQLRDSYLSNRWGVHVLRVPIRNQGYKGSKLDGPLQYVLNEIELQCRRHDKSME